MMIIILHTYIVALTVLTVLVNSKLTVYHKNYNETTRKTTWTRYNYENVMFQGGKGSSTNRGYENANDVQVRIYYELNSNLSINNFDIGDIIVGQELTTNITSQTDLSSYDTYNVTAIKNNNYGSSKIQHIHLSGK